MNTSYLPTLVKLHIYCVISYQKHIRMKNRKKKNLKEKLEIPVGVAKWDPRL